MKNFNKLIAILTLTIFTITYSSADVGYISAELNPSIEPGTSSYETQISVPVTSDGTEYIDAYVNADGQRVLNISQEVSTPDDSLAYVNINLEATKGMAKLDQGTYDLQIYAWLENSGGSDTGVIDDQNGEVQQSGIGTLTVSDIQPSFKVTDNQGSNQVGETVTLDASASDPSTDSASYLWDINNDGKFEKTGEKIGFTFVDAGANKVILRIQTPNGASTQKQKELKADQVDTESKYKSENMYLKASPGVGESVIFDMALVDDRPDKESDCGYLGCSMPSMEGHTGLVMVSQDTFATDARGVFNAKKGEIATPHLESGFSQIVDTDNCFEDATCGDPVKEVVNMDFGSSPEDFDDRCSKETPGCDVLSQERENQQGITQKVWNLRNELILAYEPGYRNNDEDHQNGNGGPYFYFCGSGYDNVNGNGGKIVSGNQDGEGNLYKCESGDWVSENVNECNNGIDDNGNGIIDGESVECSSGSKEGNIGTSGYLASNYECPAVITRVTQNDIDSTVLTDKNKGEVRTIYQDDQGQCKWGRSVKDFNGVAYKEDGEWKTDPSRLKSPVNFECNGDNAEGTSGKIDSDNQDFCTTALTKHPESGTTVKAVEFYPTKEYFVNKFDGEDSQPDIDNGVTTTDAGFNQNGNYGRWFTKPEGEGGGWQTGMMTLHQAETLYSQNNENPHIKKTWSKRGMQSLQGYQNNNPGKYQDAWQMANAGTSDGVKSKSFHGGFHGKCDSQTKWNYNTRWACGEAGTIQVEFFEENPHEGYVGFQIHESEIQKWENIFGISPEGETGVEPVQIRAECWNGKPQDRTQNAPVTNIKKQIDGVTDRNGYYIIAAEVEDRGDIQNHQHFSCNFGFQQKVTDSSVLYSGVDPFRDLEVVDTCDSSPCYLVEGSDSSGDLRVDASVSPDINYQDYIAAGADTTQTGVEGVFQQFPTGGLGSNSGTRNPLAVCQVDYGCPTGN